MAAYALGIAAESPQRSGVKRSAVRTCSGKPDPKGNAQTLILPHLMRPSSI